MRPGIIGHHRRLHRVFIPGATATCRCHRAHRRAGRSLTTLAIETSCDDTSVAILSYDEPSDLAAASANIRSARLHFHKTITADNREHQGIHPVKAHISHQKHLAGLVQEAISHLPDQHENAAGYGFVSHPGSRAPAIHPPDFITVTRGPGMRSNLITGIDTAKGLAVAWGIPLLGIHHMQAHALTPRLMSVLDTVDAQSRITELNGQTISLAGSSISPTFPFLTLLVSGGHTLLLHSRSVCSHRILTETTDMAIGLMLDMTARCILPEEVLSTARDVSYGRLLEQFAFGDDPSSVDDFEDRDAYPKSCHSYPWSFTIPFSNHHHGGKVPEVSKFSFSGIGSQAERFITRQHASTQEAPDVAERRHMAIELMRCAFEHLASRVLSALENPDLFPPAASSNPGAHSKPPLVVAGGVASNAFLRHVLRRRLDARGHADVALVFPPARFCTDNAAMVAWAGMEMWQLGWRTGLDVEPKARWSLDDRSDEGGILGVESWVRRGEVDAVG